MAFPVSLSLKSAKDDGKYLRYRSEKDETYGLLQFTGDKLGEIAAQFEVEKAKTWPGLVHIKSRYNNKYLVRRNPDNEYITASAYDTDENKRNWTCTLFEPVFNQVGLTYDENNIRLRHVQLGNFVYSPDHTGSLYNACLTASSHKHNEDFEVFTFVDWALESSKLPKRVAFKADNGKYLGVYPDANGEIYLKFMFADPIYYSKEVAQEIIPTPEGILYIKLAYPDSEFGYWKTIDEGLVVAHADDPLPHGSNNTAAMFRLIELDNNGDGDNVYALQHMNTFRFCKRLDVSGEYNDCLVATAKTIDELAQLRMIDLEAKDLPFQPKFYAPSATNISNVMEINDEDPVAKISNHVEENLNEDPLTKISNVKENFNEDPLTETSNVEENRNEDPLTETSNVKENPNEDPLTETSNIGKITKSPSSNGINGTAVTTY